MFLFEPLIYQLEIFLSLDVMFRRLAQLAEHLFYTQRVNGSNPLSLIFNYKLKIFISFFLVFSSYQFIIVLFHLLLQYFCYLAFLILSLFINNQVLRKFSLLIFFYVKINFSFDPWFVLVNLFLLVDTFSVSCLVSSQPRLCLR